MTQITPVSYGTSTMGDSCRADYRDDISNTDSNTHGYRPMERKWHSIAGKRDRVLINSSNSVSEVCNSLVIHDPC